MKASIVLAFVLAAYTPQAFSGVITCSDIENAAKAKQIYNDRITTTPETISPRLDSILRQALVIHGALEHSEVQKLTTAQLFTDYKPLFSEYSIGSKYATGVNLDLGDNAFIYLFKGVHFTGVSQIDGSVKAENDWCENIPSDTL